MSLEYKHFNKETIYTTKNAENTTLGIKENHADSKDGTVYVWFEFNDKNKEEEITFIFRKTDSRARIIERLELLIRELKEEV